MKRVWFVLSAITLLLSSCAQQTEHGSGQIEGAPSGSRSSWSCLDQRLNVPKLKDESVTIQVVAFAKASRDCGSTAEDLLQFVRARNNE